VVEIREDDPERPTVARLPRAFAPQSIQNHAAICRARQAIVRGAEQQLSSRVERLDPRPASKFSFGDRQSRI
jgi:hypothetical protein